MDGIVEVVQGVVNALNMLTPLGLSAGLAYLIYVQIKGKTAADVKIDTIRGNDLHELPTMAEDIRNMAATIQRIEALMSAEFGYLRGRLNGKQ